MSALTASQITPVLLEVVSTEVPIMYESGETTMKLMEGGKKFLTTIREFRQPVWMEPGGNYRYADFQGDYGRGSAQIPQVARVVPVERLVATEISATIQMLTKSPTQTVIDVFTRQVQNSTIEFRTMTDRDIQGSGNGVMGTIATGGISGTTFTLDSPFYTQRMRVNDIFVVMDSGQTVIRGTLRVTAIDDINNTITVSNVPAGTVVTDVLCVEGYGTATTTTLTGIAYHQNNAATGTWETLSRVTYPYIRTPSLNAAGATLTVAQVQKLQTLLDDVKGDITVNGSSDWVLHMHSRQRTLLASELNQQMYVPWGSGTAAEVIDPGKQVKSLAWCCGFQVHASNHASRTRVDLLKKSNWYRIQYKDVGPMNIADDGRTWLPIYGASGGFGGKQITYIGAAEQVCVYDPRAGAYIYGLAEPTGY